MFFLQLHTGWQRTLEFFLRTYRRSGCHRGIRSRSLFRLRRLRNINLDVRSRPRRLAANVENIGPFFQQFLGMFDGPLAVEKLAAVGKRIRSDIHDTHDQRALAELQRPPAQIPLKDRSHARTILTEQCWHSARNGAIGEGRLLRAYAWLGWFLARADRRFSHSFKQFLD